MKSDGLTFFLVVISLIVGFWIGAKVMLDDYNEFFEYVLMGIVSLLIAFLILLGLYGLCNWLEPVQVTEHNGVVVNRMIRGETQEESTVIIDGYPYQTTSITPSACLLKVRDDLTKQIVTIEVSEETYYNKPSLKIGTKVNYNKETGTLTGDEDFELVSF